jgi:hypothetical protein
MPFKQKIIIINKETVHTKTYIFQYYIYISLIYETKVKIELKKL